MAKRIRQVDVLKEIRRALRALNRAERSILAVERADKRMEEKARERAELHQLARDSRSEQAGMALMAGDLSGGADV